MNFPKGQDFSKRLKLMGPFFLFKRVCDLLWFLVTRWVKKGSFIFYHDTPKSVFASIALRAIFQKHSVVYVFNAFKASELQLNSKIAHLSLP